MPASAAQPVAPDVGQPAKPIAPSRHRLALLVLIGVYPLITVIIYAVAPLTEGWSIWQRNLLVAPIMVAAMVYGLIPAIHRHFHRFLTPARPGR